MITAEEPNESASEDLLFHEGPSESNSIFPCFKGKLKKLADDTPLRRPENRAS